MTQFTWVLCPICGNKTRTKIRPDTEAKNLIVFCPRCKRESVVDIERETPKTCECQLLRRLKKGSVEGLGEIIISSDNEQVQILKKTDTGKYYLHTTCRDFRKNKIVAVESCPICGEKF